MGVVLGATGSGQIVSRIGRYKAFMVGGGTVLLLGLFGLTRLSADTPFGVVMALTALCGLGVGPTLPLFPLAVQNAVDARRLGQATSATQFFRQVGAAVGTAAMGAVLALTLLSALGPSAAAAPPEPPPGEAVSALPPRAVREAYADATRRVYTLALGFGVLGWTLTLFVPSLPLRRTFDVEPAGAV
jgi:MFS family permease